jgi:hypothetical protein
MKGGESHAGVDLWEMRAQRKRSVPSSEVSQMWSSEGEVQERGIISA